MPRSASDLQRLLQLDPSSVESVLDAASIEAYDWRLREQVGNELIGIESQTMLTTGDEIFDDILKGGIPLGTITEVVGER